MNKITFLSIYLALFTLFSMNVSAQIYSDVDTMFVLDAGGDTIFQGRVERDNEQTLLRVPVARANRSG